VHQAKSNRPEAQIIACVSITALSHNSDTYAPIPYSIKDHEQYPWPSRVNPPPSYNPTKVPKMTFWQKSYYLLYTINSKQYTQKKSKCKFQIPILIQHPNLSFVILAKDSCSFRHHECFPINSPFFHLSRKPLGKGGLRGFPYSHLCHPESFPKDLLL